MHCKLCLCDRELRKSHIIPEFLYRDLYDEKHRLDVLSLLPNQPHWREQKGLREHMLCDECEQKLSVYEHYAKRVLSGGEPLQARVDGRARFVSGLDYTKMRLFLLSILWRAGASSLDFFKRVQLGEHEERMRALLMAEDPGNPFEFACVMFGLHFQDKALTDAIMQPVEGVTQGQQTYRFLFGGFLWVFFVASDLLPESMRPFVLQSNGDLAFLVKDATELPDLRTFALDLVRSGRDPV